MGMLPDGTSYPDWLKPGSCPPVTVPTQVCSQTGWHKALGAEYWETVEVS